MFVDTSCCVCLGIPFWQALRTYTSLYTMYWASIVCNHIALVVVAVESYYTCLGRQSTKDSRMLEVSKLSESAPHGHAPTESQEACHTPVYPRRGTTDMPQGPGNIPTLPSGLLRTPEPKIQQIYIGVSPSLALCIGEDPSAILLSRFSQGRRHCSADAY